MVDSERGKDGKVPWRPTPVFYLTHPEARELYPLCVRAVNIVRRVIGPELVSVDERRGLYSEMERIEGEFITRGITQGMNTELPEEAYKGDPLLTIQYAAGQLMYVTGHSLPSEKQLSEQSAIPSFYASPVQGKPERELFVDHTIGMWIRNHMMLALGMEFPEEGI